jgi:general secretion pathway protein K
MPGAASDQKAERRREDGRQDGGRQGGFALVLVLGTLVLIAALSLGLVQTSRLEVRRAANMAAADKARALLDAGVALAVFDADRPLRARRFRPAGPATRVGLGDATLDIRVFEDWGRVDLNRSNPLLLRGLIEAVGEDADNARAIADTVAARRGDTMASRAREDGQPHRPFLSVAELATVPGVTPDLLRRLWDEVTVDGAPGRLSVAAAGPLTLASLPNLSAADRAAVIALAGGWATGGGVGGAGGAADSGLAERAAAAGVELDPEGGFPIVGRTLTVRVRASKDGAEALAEAVVVLSDVKSPTPYRVVEWREPPGL